MRFSANKHYSALALAKHAVSSEPWPRVWRSPEPKRSYDVVIIGGGGHGLATAYYFAANHGVTNVAVIERAYIGSGNVGRNTTLVRSNYMLDGNTQFFEYSLKLWEGLSHELNYNVMLSQRGQIVSRAWAGAARRAGAQGQHHATEWHRRRTPGPRRCDASAALSRLFRPCALPDLRRADAAACRHGAPRCGRVGLCTGG